MATIPSFDINRLRQQFTLGGQDYGLNMGGGIGMGGGDDGSAIDTIGRPPVSTTFPTDTSQTMDPRIPRPQANLSRVGDTQGQSIEELAASMDKIYNPQYESRDRYNTLLGDYPEREEPSWARKIVAGSMGMSARNHNENPLTTMESVLNMPHIRDVADWKEQVDPNYKAADLENRSNINERTLAGNILTNKYQTDRFMEQGRQADEKARIAEEKNRATATNTANNARLKYLAQTGWKVDYSGPTIIATRTNPDTGLPEKMEMGDTGKVDEQTRLDTQGYYRVQAANQFGANQANVANIREGAFFHDEAGNSYRASADGNLTRMGTAPATPVGKLTPASPDKALTGSAATVADQQKLRSIYNTYPQYQNRKFWTTQDDGSIALAPRPKMGSWLQTDASDRADIAAWDQLAKLVYPNYVPPTEDTPTQPTPKTGGTPQAPAGANPGNAKVPPGGGKPIEMIAPDGKTKLVFPVDIPGAEARGFRRKQ